MPLVQWNLPCTFLLRVMSYVIDDGQTLLHNRVDLGHEGGSNFFNILQNAHEHKTLSFIQLYGFGWLMYRLVIVSKIVWK